MLATMDIWIQGGKEKRMLGDIYLPIGTCRNWLWKGVYFWAESWKTDRLPPTM